MHELHVLIRAVWDVLRIQPSKITLRPKRSVMYLSTRVRALGENKDTTWAVENCRPLWYNETKLPSYSGVKTALTVLWHSHTTQYLNSITIMGTRGRQNDVTFRVNVVILLYWGHRRSENKTKCIFNLKTTECIGDEDHYAQSS